MERRFKRPLILQVKYRGYPEPTFAWYDNFGRQILTTNYRYKVEIDDNYIILKIDYLWLEDSGNYTLKAHNALNSTEKNIELLVKGSSVKFNSIEVSLEKKIAFSVSFGTCK